MKTFKNLPLRNLFFYGLLGMTIAIMFFVACNRDANIPDIDTSDVLDFDKSGKRLSSEVLEIKNWFDNNEQKSNFNNSCRTVVDFDPQWYQAHLLGEIVEIPVIEDDYLPFPKLANAPMKLGKKTLITRILGNERHASILSFMPSNNFTGQTTQLTSRNFRQMNFDGVIAFQELSGCLFAAYLVENGVIRQKLSVSEGTNGIQPRGCTEVWTEYWQIGSDGAEHKTGESTHRTVCDPLVPISTGSSYDDVMGSIIAGNGSSGTGTSSGSSGDATYGAYLSSFSIDRINILCTATFQWTARTCNVNNQCAIGNHLAAGMKPDGFRFTTNGGQNRTIGFGFVLFTLPSNSPNFSNLTQGQASSIVATAVNSAVQTVQNEITSSSVLLSDEEIRTRLWSLVSSNIGSAMGFTGVGSDVGFVTRSSAPLPYNNLDGNAPSNWGIYNVPMTRDRNTTIGC